MMKMLLLVLLLGVVLMSCTTIKVEDHAAEGPLFDPVSYFTGKTVAHGFFQDRFGKVRKRFVVDIEGIWDGAVLKLVEDFRYTDGDTEQRIWHLRKTGDSTWVGKAEGVVGEAQGRVSGNAMNLSYMFDMVTGENKRKLRVKFDDWLWLQGDGVLINRAYVTKYGVRVGDVTITFAKTG